MSFKFLNIGAVSNRHTRSGCTLPPNSARTHRPKNLQLLTPDTKSQEQDVEEQLHTLEQRILSFEFSSNELIEMMGKLKSIVPMRDYRHRFHHFEQCFTGADSVDALQQVLLKDGHQIRRELVVTLCEHLCESGWIFHVIHQHKFKDSNSAPFLYKINENYKRVSTRHDLSIHSFSEHQKFINDLTSLQEEFAKLSKLYKIDMINNSSTIGEIIDDSDLPSTMSHAKQLHSKTKEKAQRSDSHLFPSNILFISQSTKSEFLKTPPRNRSKSEFHVSSISPSDLFTCNSSSSFCDLKRGLRLRSPRSAKDSSPRQDLEEMGINVESIKKLTLRQLLENDKLRSEFKRFAQKESSEENVLFWEEVEKYKKIPSAQHRSVLGTKLYQLFVPSSSPYSLNLPGNVCTTLSTEYSSGAIDVFDSAQVSTEVTMLDTFKRFKNSDAYLSFFR